MAILGAICILIGLVIGLVIGLIFGIQIIILAFQESVLWGLGYLCVPFVGLIFIVMFWEQTKTPFLRSMIGVPFYAVGMLLVGPVAE